MMWEKMSNYFLLLLKDTEEMYTHSTQKVAQRFGKTFTWELKVKQMGLPSLELGALIVREMSLPMTAEEYLKEVQPIQQGLFPTAEFMPGILRMRSINLYICSKPSSQNLSRFTPVTKY